MIHSHRSQLAGAALAFAALAGAGPLRAQDRSPDPRWQVFYGCWQPVERPGEFHAAASAPRMCVVPLAGNGVQVWSVMAGQVVSRDSIVASGEPQPLSGESCTGSQRTAWSDQGLRLFRRSEASCPDRTTKRTSSILAISPAGEWLEIGSITLDRGTAVRVRRYAPLTNAPDLPQEVTDALQPVIELSGPARAAATEPIGAADVIEAAGLVDSTVLEAWISEIGQTFPLNARRLTELSRAGVSGRVTDLLVALAYPTVFTFGHGQEPGNKAALAEQRSGGMFYGGSVAGFIPYSGYEYGPYGYSRFAYNPYCDAYGYGSQGYDIRAWNGAIGDPCRYNGAWYWNSRPQIVWVGNGGGVNGSAGAPPHGKVVNGYGYSSGGVTSGSVAHPVHPDVTPRSGGGGTSVPSSGGGASSGGYSSPSGGATSGGTTGSTSSGGRTAKPRP